MLYYEEIFASIQGESRSSGEPCIFVRLFGCPIGCSYCDQKQDVKKRKKISIENVVSKVQNYKGIKRVCITGGEPLIYEELYQLVWELMHLGYKVEIETSGCLPIEITPYRRTFRYIMDIKCPSSGVSHKNIYDNLLHLNAEDDVVFVIKDREDYNFMKKVVTKYPTNATIMLSPMFDEKGTNVIGKELVKWVLEDKLNVKIQLQLHKLLFVK